MVQDFNKQTGEFTIRVRPEDILRAPNSMDGTPQKWIPCSQCGRLTPVSLRTRSVVCSQECEDGMELADERAEYPGYSHACGYHD